MNCYFTFCCHLKRSSIRRKVGQVMKRLLEVGLVLCLALPLGTALPAAAHHKGVHGKHATVKYYRAAKPRAQGTRVLGYELRWGGG